MTYLADVDHFVGLVFLDIARVNKPLYQLHFALEVSTQGRRGCAGGRRQLSQGLSQRTESFVVIAKVVNFNLQITIAMRKYKCNQPMSL